MSGDSGYKEGITTGAPCVGGIRLPFMLFKRCDMGTAFLTAACEFEFCLLKFVQHLPRVRSQWSKRKASTQVDKIKLYRALQ